MPTGAGDLADEDNMQLAHELTASAASGGTSG